MAFKVARGIRVEELDGSFLVLLRGHDEVLRFDGAQAEAFRAALDGAAELPVRLEKPMAGLIAMGVVEADSWTRRRLIQLGVGAAVAVVALPKVAAAASPGTSPTAPSKPTSLEVSYLVVAGGGGGGQAGGGGAGGVIQNAVALTVGMSYPVAVGSGGTGAGDSTAPSNGDASSFGSFATAIGGGHGAGEIAAAAVGGSGGGGSTVSHQSGAAGSPGQGSAGGNGNMRAYGLEILVAAGGGGGSVAPGGNGDLYQSPIAAGKGGAGSYSPVAAAMDIGSPTGWVGGGGGGLASDFVAGGVGGTGGGGNGVGSGSGSSGLPLTGGGGGGGEGHPGGSGIVIIAYSSADATGLVVSGGDRVIPFGGTTYHLFYKTENGHSFSVS